MELILKREIILDKAILRMLTVGFFITAISLGAFVRIPLPFTPVPITLQTFFVLLSAAFLRLRLGVFTQLGYILLGALGLPIFTGAGTGLLYLIGPTGGYLFGFIAAAFFIAALIKYTKDNLVLITALFCFADFLLLFCGSAWLKFSLSLTWQKSFLIGFIPFLSGDMLKALLAALLFLKLKPRVKEIL